MTARFVAWGFAAAAVAAGAAFGAQASGGDAGAWLGLGGGARAAALANTYVAVADEPSAAFFNAAGLQQLTGGRAEFTYHYPYADVKDIAYANAAAAYNLAGRGYELGTVALGAQYFRAWGIPEAGDLGLTGRTFSDYELNLVVAWGKGLGADVAAGEGPRYNLGLAMKMVSSKIYEYQDSGFGLDVGFLLRPLPAVRVGLALANVIAPHIELVATRDVYPATATVGAAYDLFPGGVATAEGRFRKDGDAAFGVGAEATIARVFAVRGGYEYPDNQPAAGVGLRMSKYGADFTWRPNGDLGDSYIATVTVSF